MIKLVFIWIILKLHKQSIHTLLQNISTAQILHKIDPKAHTLSFSQSKYTYKKRKEERKEIDNKTLLSMWPRDTQTAPLLSVKHQYKI